ncbi:hypothetical protein DL93DRAFT_2159950 [Clavulina sp. PMI_390]|nr:hypothetical protein DL93DRAFT_2159950 [Clavulina sp. PMI_390]
MSPPSRRLPNASELAKKYMDSEDFEQLKNEIIEELMSSSTGEVFNSQVDEVASELLAKQEDNLDVSDDYQAERMERLILRELERYPLVERAMNQLNTIANDHQTSKAISEDLAEALKAAESASSPGDGHPEFEEGELETVAITSLAPTEGRVPVNGMHTNENAEH